MQKRQGASRSVDNLLVMDWKNKSLIGVSRMGNILMVLWIEIVGKINPKSIKNEIKLVRNFGIAFLSISFDF